MIETTLLSTVDEYIQISKEKYGYNAEQALGMLFWHKVSARSFEVTYYDFMKQEYMFLHRRSSTTWTGLSKTWQTSPRFRTSGR